ncbi:MAG: hypothetical protein H7Z13_17615 [Ferruginibacter sp.]|nr:hypothetical protein [Ferruginibacter sp.]
MKRNVKINGIWKSFTGWNILLFCGIFVAANTKNASFPELASPANQVGLPAPGKEVIHPRGLMNAAGQRAIWLKVSDMGYLNKVKKLEEKLLKQHHLQDEKLSVKNAYAIGELLESFAFLYAITQNKNYAEKVTALLEQTITDSTVFHQPILKGLTRAQLVKAAAVSYDLCYHDLPVERRAVFSKQILLAALSMESVMGVEANYAQESNWMGVRYGTVLFAALVCDEPIASGFKNSLADALVWDARERLRDHIQQNINPDGWTAESMGYHFYNWSFIAPALIALENSTHLRGKAINQLAPHAIQSARAAATACISMSAAKGKGIKADLADDNLGVDANFFWYALRLYPEAQLPFIKWTALYLESIHDIKSLFLKLAFDDASVLPQNPTNAAWLNFVDPTQGVTVFRNRFKDSNDIVATFTVTAKRVRAHQSGDNLSFRILGLNNIWAIGAGRTGLKAGQTNLFPEEQIPLNKNYESGKTGLLISYKFEPNGSGTAIGSGSCMGVESHQRIFKVDYDTITDAQAVFIVTDSSENGKTWRLNTPAFNQVLKQPDGFLINAPDGSSMKAIVIGKTNAQLKVNISDVPYDGVTKENTTGIYFKGHYYKYSKAIDICCDKNITVVLTLTKKGQPHPAVSQHSNQSVLIGRKQIFLSN